MESLVCLVNMVLVFNFLQFFFFFFTQVGHSGMKIAQIAENVVAVADFLAEKYPGGWSNVRSLHIKTPNSKAVPVFYRLSKDSISPLFQEIFHIQTIIILQKKLLNLILKNST